MVSQQFIFYYLWYSEDIFDGIVSSSPFRQLAGYSRNGTIDGNFLIVIESTFGKEFFVRFQLVVHRVYLCRAEAAPVGWYRGMVSRPVSVSVVLAIMLLKLLSIFNQELGEVFVSYRCLIQEPFLSQLSSFVDIYCICLNGHFPLDFFYNTTPELIVRDFLSIF